MLQPNTLTQEQRTAYEQARKLLLVPVPADKTYTVDKGGRGGFTVADVDYLEQRLTEADPAWQGTVEVNGDVLMFHLTIHGVTRTGEAGIEAPETKKVPQWSKNRDTGKNEREKDDAGKTIYRLTAINSRHMQVGAAKAAAERRACAMHGLGAHLWPSKLNDQQAGAQPSGTRSATSAPSSDGFKRPSDNQLKWLGDMGVPEAIAVKLNAAGGKESQASSVIGYLLGERNADKQGFDNNKSRHVAAALKKYAPSIEFVETAAASQDDDEDYMED